MDVVFDSLPCSLLRCLEKGADIDVKTEICEGRSNNFLSPVMAILADFRYENAWAPAFMASWSA